MFNLRSCFFVEEENIPVKNNFNDKENVIVMKLFYIIFKEKNNLSMNTFASNK